MPDPVTLNNNAVYSIVNAARTQALGGGSTQQIAALDIHDIIDAGGSSIVLTGRRGSARAIVVVLGSNTAKERDAAASRLLVDALSAISW